MMSTDHKVTCDACGNDLTWTSNCMDYSLALRNRRIGSKGSGAVTSMAVYPAIDRDADFCGIDCLRLWLDANYPAGARHHGGKAWAESQREERRAKQKDQSE